MSEPLGIEFGCIGCGAMNPIGAEVCGCGHRFAGPDLVTTPAELPIAPPVRRPMLPVDQYEPPKARIAPPPTFRIGTLMAFIAVVAVCLAGFAAHPSLGIVATVGLVPAAIRTFLVSDRASASGRPMSLAEQIGTFFMTIWGTVAVVCSLAIGFCGTCIPASLMTNDIRAGVIVGTLGGATLAFFAGRGLRRIARSRENDRNQIRWQ